MEPITDKPFLPHRLYEAFRWFVQIVLPAFSALYLGLSDLWDLPEPVAVGATAGLVGTFLGTIMRFSKHNYDNSDSRFFGEIHVRPNEEGAVIDHQVFNEDPNGGTLADKKEVTFKVVHS